MWKSFHEVSTKLKWFEFWSRGKVVITFCNDIPFSRQRFILTKFLFGFDVFVALFRVLSGLHIIKLKSILKKKEVASFLKTAGWLLLNQKKGDEKQEIP